MFEPDAREASAGASRRVRARGARVRRAAGGPRGGLRAVFGGRQGQAQRHHGPVHVRMGAEERRQAVGPEMEGCLKILGGVSYQMK